MNIQEVKNLKMIGAFHGDFAAYETTDEKAGIINRKGEIILPADKYRDISHCQDTIFELWTEIEERTFSITAYFDAKLQREVPQPEFEPTPEIELPSCAKKYTDAYWCATNRIAFKEGELYGIMDGQGNEIVAPSYDWIQHSQPYGYKNQRISVKKDGLNGYLDFDGNVVIPFEYPYVGHRRMLGIHLFHTKADKWGIMNEKGQIIIPAIYDSIRVDNTRGLDEMAVKKDGHCYFINAKQEEVKVF